MNIWPYCDSNRKVFSVPTIKIKLGDHHYQGTRAISTHYIIYVDEARRWCGVMLCQIVVWRTVELVDWSLAS